MQFKLDENLPVEIVALLIAAGHDAVTVHDQHLVGAPDATLAEVCRDEGRCLMTLDRGFADLRTFPLDGRWSAIVIRPAFQSRTHVLAIVERLIETMRRETPENSLWIASESEVRIRRFVE